MASRADQSGADSQRDRMMTVLKVRDHSSGAEVIFMESARIYRLRADTRSYAATLAVLRAGVADGKKVSVRLAEANGELIASARPAKAP
jgi:hypothetical protein